MSKTKTKPFGLRIPVELHDKLDRIALYMNKSSNQVAIQAIDEWVEVVFEMSRWRLVMMSKEMVISILSAVPDKKLDVMAIEMSDIISEIFRDIVEKPIKPENYKLYITMLPDLFGEKKLNWFSKIIVDFKSVNYFIVRGFHHMGEPFSKFFSKLIKNLMSSKFDVTMEPISEYEKNSIFLEFSADTSRDG